MNVRISGETLFTVFATLVFVFILGSCVADLPSRYDYAVRADIYCTESGYHEGDFRPSALLTLWSDRVWYECSSWFDAEHVND